jgi:alpha-beta hydrolase superfamily lysophospholipase
MFKMFKNGGSKGGGAGAVTSVNGKIGGVVITKDDIGISNDFTTPEKDKLARVNSIKKSFGLLIPQFKTVGKFDYLGAALPANQLALHSSGVGLVSSTAGTFSDGYLKLSSEVTGNQANRLDWFIAWNTAEANASISVGLGDAANGYLVTIANTSGNVVVTWPSGATVSAVLTGTVNISLSITTGNAWITCSMSVLGVIALSLAASNPYNVPVFECVKLAKPNLAHVYFKNNSIASRIVGFLHNSKSYDGDPTGQLLTQSVIVNAGWITDEDENMIILPARSNPLIPLKVVQFFHGRTQAYKDFINVAVGDFGKTAYTLLNAGYAVISTSGGVGTINSDTDGFGSPRWLDKAEALFDVVQNNVSNILGEYLEGWSMGGVAASNYLRRNHTRVKAVWLSCPVMDLQESGVRTSLGVNIDAAYAPFYISKSDSNVADPRTDGGVNWALISDPGADPIQGIKILTATRTTAASTNSNAVTLASNLKLVPGDMIYFKYSKVWAKVAQMLDTNTTITILDRNVTVLNGEPIGLIPIGRDLSQIGNGYEWRDRLTQEIVVGTSYSKGKIVRRTSANPINDTIPHNPINFADLFAELNVPYHIMVGGDGTAAGNDTILNNNQMFAFATKVNALNAGLVVMVPGSGSHVSPTSISSSDTLTFFNAH